MQRLNLQDPLFRDRIDAGKKLADQLEPYIFDKTVILAIPSGGIPVANEVSQRFGILFDVIITRKIPIPYNPEAGYGAVTEDGDYFLNQQLLNQLDFSQQQIQRHVYEVLSEIRRRDRFYRKRFKRVPLTSKTVVIIDDGLASGFTMIAAIRSAQKQQPLKIVAASPVASGNAFELIKPECDAVVCLHVKYSYPFAVANFYRNWHDLTDEEIDDYLNSRV